MLKGLRVVEFAEGVAGPLAGLRLSELGLEVIKLERPEGDWLRRAAPALRGEDVSAAFFDLNRGKRSVGLGPHPAAARHFVQTLLERADVFITDRSEEELGALGIESLDAPCPGNRRLITVTLSAWGRRGPLAQRKGSELAAQAMAGYTRYLGSHGEPARRLGADVASAGTGLFVLQAVLAALYRRHRSHKGQRIDLSLVNSLLAMKSIHLAAQSEPDTYEGPRVGGANHPPERGWATGDEPIFFQFGGSVGSRGRPGWVEFVKEIGLEQLLDDPRCDEAGRTSTGHGLHTHELRGTYEHAFSRFSSDRLSAIIRKHGGNAAKYMRADETVAHPQTQALNIVREVAAAGGKAAVRAFPARFSRLVPRLNGRAPKLAEHTAEVAAELGIQAVDFERLCTEGAVICGPRDDGGKPRNTA